MVHCFRTARRKAQFSLRWFLASVLIVGALIGWYGKRVNDQRVAAARIRALGGMVVYDYELRSTPNARLLRLLGGTLGKDVIGEVVWVRIYGDAEATDSCIPTLLYFTAVEKIELTCPSLSDEGLLRLAQLKSLRVLDLHYPSVSDGVVFRLRHLLPKCDINCYDRRK